MFNPNQQGGKGTLVGDTDKNTRQIEGAAGGRLKELNTAVNYSCALLICKFYEHQLISLIANIQCVYN